MLMIELTLFYYYDILLLLLLVGTIGFFSRADFDLRRSAVDDAS